MSEEILENTELAKQVLFVVPQGEHTPIQEEVVVKPFPQVVQEVTMKYMTLAHTVQEKYKYSHDVAGAMEAGIRNFVERQEQNDDQVLYNLADSFLYCLEELHDHNADYFMYQMDKIKKKNGKVEKQKVSRLIGKAQMKHILKECDEKGREFIFHELVECFKMLTKKDEDGQIIFYPEFVEFVKKNLNDNKNFSKMLVSIDCVDSILDDSQAMVTYEKNLDESDSEDEKKKKGKKGKKKSAEKGGMFEDAFMKGLEGTKIAQLAQNISSKIKPQDFPELNDPMKLMSSLQGDGGGIANLLKFVVGEVQEAMTKDGMKEEDLVGEATNLMGNFKNMAGFDPMSMFKNMAEGGNPTMPPMPGMPAEMGNIFENLNRTLGEELRRTVEKTNEEGDCMENMGKPKKE